MSTPIPLKYTQVARAQVSQFIEGADPSFVDHDNSVLGTIAQTNLGASNVTFATEITPVEYYASP